jgi:hypothetical protein
MTAGLAISMNREILPDPIKYRATRPDEWVIVTPRIEIVVATPSENKELRKIASP